MQTTSCGPQRNKTPLNSERVSLKSEQELVVMVVEGFNQAATLGKETPQMSVIWSSSTQIYSNFESKSGPRNP